MAIPVGSKAPAFTLKSKFADGIRDVSLSDYLGKRHVLLLFFPGVFTHVCTQQFCDASTGLSAYTDLGAEVLGVSTDSVYSQEAWSKSIHNQVPLLADYRHDVIRAYDVVWPDFSGMGPSAARAAVLVGKDGFVKYAEHCPKLTDLPDIAAIQDALAHA